MCLYAKTGEIKIAKRNIVVHKFFRVPWGEKESVVRSYPRNYTYELNKEYVTSPMWSRRVNPIPPNARINYGFHSCVKDKRKDGVTGVRYHAIIPKGAKYVIGRENDIVSTAIIIKKRCKSTKK